MDIKILKSKQSAVEKYNLNEITFGSVFSDHMFVCDYENNVCEKFGVWVEKSMYGRKYMGVQRATFLSNEKGIITNVWEKVKVPGHAEDVLKAVEAISK